MRRCSYPCLGSGKTLPQGFRDALAERGDVSAAGCQHDAMEKVILMGRRLLCLLALPSADPMTKAVLEMAGMGLSLTSQFQFAF